MTATSTAALRRLERRAARSGAAAADVDSAVADQLGVPVDYYLAYLVVERALTAQHADADPGQVAERDHIRDAWQLTDRLGGLAAQISRCATSVSRPAAGDIPGLCAQIFATLLQLRRHLDAGPRPEGRAWSWGWRRG